jgi:tetratricopeptide (TPR) repeat protein
METTEGYSGGKASTAVGEIMQRAYGLLRASDISAAQADFESALKLDFDDPEVMYALQCSGFWVDRMDRAEEFADPFDRGEFILGQWKSFAAFASRLSGASEDASYAFRHFAFSAALDCFLAVHHEPADGRGADLSLRIGKCFKGRGEFTTAIQHLEEALKARREDPEIIACLADAYAMVDETRTSKALFREAFFLDAGRVDVETMESFLVRGLVERVRAMGYSGRELAEWIPVHAALLGVFNVKRELRPVESGKLRQAIYQLENDLKEHDADRSVLVPKLLNRYFWLVDHLVASREDRSKIDEVLLKIRILDPQIHKKFTS